MFTQSQTRASSIIVFQNTARKAVSGGRIPPLFSSLSGRVRQDAAAFASPALDLEPEQVGC